MQRLGEAPMSTDHDRLRDDIAKALTRLRTLRDEARVKIHLGSMDARDAWGRLEPRLLEAERAAEHVSQATLETIDAVTKTLSDLVLAL
jgi:hypothetical protein